MKDFFYFDILIWFSIPTILLFFLNLFCIYRKVHCSPTYYLFSLGIGLAGFLFGPSCMCQDIDQKAIGSILFVLFVSAIFILIIAGRIFSLKGALTRGAKK